MGEMIDEAVDCGIVFTAFSAIIGLAAGMAGLALELALVCLGLMLVRIVRGCWKRRRGR
jgi:hypothetical protein